MKSSGPFKGVPEISRSVLVGEEYEFLNAQHARRIRVVVDVTVKPCSACRKIKELDQFPQSKNTRSGKASVCLICARNRVYETRGKKAGGPS